MHCSTPLHRRSTPLLSEGASVPACRHLQTHPKVSFRKWSPHSISSNSTTSAHAANGRWQSCSANDADGLPDDPAPTPSPNPPASTLTASTSRRGSLFALTASAVLLGSVGGLSRPHVARAEEETIEVSQDVPQAVNPPEVDPQSTSEERPTGRVERVESTATAYVQDFASDVPHDLVVQEYYSIIVSKRPKCYQQLAQLLQSKQYEKMAQLPSQAPFSDLRAAALYASWALLQAADYNAAKDCRKAYVDFDGHVKDLEQISVAAAFDGVAPEQVQQAFILLNASLAQLLFTIPSKYISIAPKADDMM